ncbi:MAG TPA: C1 family peptidase [Gammaproteobacteria bacterium]|nr:C1 family peptidase [Gammaproteobacteria bacterium]
MNKQLIMSISCVIAAIFTTSSQAIEIGRPITTSVVITKLNNQADMPVPLQKQVTLMNIILPPQAQQGLFAPKIQKSLTTTKESDTLPSFVNLGMNHVPVLDQGQHGTCVTFAITAAIDALLGKGDYLSQLCNLELGNYLEKKGYAPSGWNGSFGPWVIDQIRRFGIINKNNQRTQSCAGIKEYPTNDGNDPKVSMTLNAFKQMSENVRHKFYSVYVMNISQRVSTNFSDIEQAEKALQYVKQSLARGNRLTFGVILVLIPHCSAGACATYQAKYDTWALTTEANEPNHPIGGHEMVIIGYDDQAIAIDKEGKSHQGLLFLRNSWGDDVGDYGNYYMTYDYFKKFVAEIQEMVKK